MGKIYFRIYSNTLVRLLLLAPRVLRDTNNTLGYGCQAAYGLGSDSCFLVSTCRFISLRTCPALSPTLPVRYPKKNRIPEVLSTQGMRFKLKHQTPGTHGMYCNRPLFQS